MAAQINLQPAREKAGAEFAAADPEAMAANALVEYNPQEAFFTIPYLGQHYRVYYPGGKVVPEGKEGKVPLANEIVLLHYLAHCSPRGVEGANIAFSELPSGSIYVGPFTNRAIRPLVAIFGDKPGMLVEAAKKLGGCVMPMGDAAVTVPVLPKIPITFVLWAGDDEFPASGNVLFDVSAPSHLHTEDYALLPGLAIWEMKRLTGLQEKEERSMSETKGVSSEIVFRGKILDVRRDNATLPDGRTATMEVVYSADATAVVAVSSDGEVLLIDQYRYVAGGMLLEIPAGKMEPGEKPLDCARRELEEETGFRAESWSHLVTFYTSPGFCTERIHLFLASDLTRHSQNLDRDEFIEVNKMPLEKALEMVNRGDLNDAKTIVGLLMAKQILNK